MILSVVIPCLNESETIAICIKKSIKQIKLLKIKGEVIVADNGSIDGSIEIAKKNGAKVINVKEKGYGAALRAGFSAAKGKYIIMGDGDDSYDFNFINKFYQKIETGYDLVQGCRFPSGGGVIEKGAMPISHRLVGNPFLTKVSRFLHKVPFNDMYCGMKMFRKSFLEKLSFFSTGMVFCMELVIKFHNHGSKSCELPIIFKKDGRKKGKSHIRTFYDGFSTLKFLLICCPKWLFFIPSLILFLISTYQVFNSHFSFSESELFKIFFLQILSIQLLMLGLFASVLSEKIGLGENRYLKSFFKYFTLSLAIILFSILGTLSLFTKIFIIQETYPEYLSIICDYIVFLSIMIIFNSFFVSLLNIEKEI